MKPAADVMLAYWNEHRQQLRQSENQRATLTNYVLVTTAALTGLAVQQRLDLRTLPLSALIVFTGLYGAVAAAKYHERADYHLSQARALTRTLRELGALPDAEAALDEHRRAHYQKYPLLHRIRLHVLWTGLNLTIAAFGLAMIGITLGFKG